MSGVSLPVTRSSGRALLVGNPSSRSGAGEALGRLGYACAESDDPYAAMAELCRRPLAYRAIILSLPGLYREELPVISAIKGRYPHVEVWLAHTDGRQPALAEAMRLGADGLLDDEGLHRVALGNGAAAAGSANPYALSSNNEDVKPLLGPVRITVDRGEPASQESDSTDGGECNGEPILSADELRALLQEQPAMLSADDGEALRETEALTDEEALADGDAPANGEA